MSLTEYDFVETRDTVLVSGDCSEARCDLCTSKALLKKKFPLSHPIFRPSSPAPQSQNPQNISNILAVLLNRRDQIWPKSGREKCEFIFEQRLNGKNSNTLLKKHPNYLR